VQTKTKLQRKLVPWMLYWNVWSQGKIWIYKYIFISLENQK